ncbi:MAG: SRPBCC family protein, partial [Planctomycetota bacterium]|nr:SRPBCC family protein [Planctomycetota bacterium]
MWQRCKDIVNIEPVTAGPVREGTVFKETRAVFGRESTETMTFTEYQPPNRWAIGGDSCGSRFTTSFDLQAEGEGTRVIVNTRVKALNPVAWVMGFFAPLLFGTMKRAMNRDLDTLSQIADGTWTEPVEEDEPEDQAKLT